MHLVRMSRVMGILESGRVGRESLDSSYQQRGLGIVNFGRWSSVQ